MDKKLVGERGESIFNTRITEHEIFQVYFLSAKAPVVDFLIEIADEATPFQCLIQVKSTTLGYLKGNGELRAKVPADKMQKLINRPLPTYVAGVDIINEKVYICPAFNNVNAYTSSMPIKHVLDKQNAAATRQTLNLLKQDIIDYWNQSNINAYKANFRSRL